MGADLLLLVPKLELGNKVDGGAWEQGQKISLSLDGRGLG
jgi:hypothetical protein